MSSSPATDPATDPGADPSADPSAAPGADPAAAGGPPAVRPRTAVLGRGEVPWDAPVAAADDLGLSRGDGVFETLLVRGGNPARVVGLQAHLERLERSAAALELPAPDRAAWGALARELAAGVPAGAEATLRLTLTRGAPGAGPTGLAALRPLPAETLRARERGVRVVALARGTSAHLHAEAPWLLGGAKTLSYAVHTAALREAARRGADDALFTSTEGLVLEGPTATVLWWAGGRLLTTPAGPSGILEGTTQRAVFAAAGAEGLPTGVEEVAVPGLLAAEAVWLASSVRGAVEVTHLDGTALARRPELTRRLRGWALA
ncbi:aminotransferase class IV [Kineococcus sp. SYSU DK005]|uniref:aminotransferase class IV n=1 Tax=Kineococcus sp. SYSU DK005 TaxID=3383126 RepID=UPI003D7DA70A